MTQNILERNQKQMTPNVLERNQNVLGQNVFCVAVKCLLIW